MILPAYIVSSDPVISEVFQRYNQPLGTMSFCSEVQITSTPPPGCAILTLTGHCEIHLLLKGLIEPEKELSKMEKKQKDLTAVSLDNYKLSYIKFVINILFLVCGQIKKSHVGW